MQDTRPLLLETDFPPLLRADLRTLQVNLGYVCNLSCVHCHVNAGPHRVDRWRHPPGEGVPVDIWVDTIPYKETREYVQAVLFYNVVFQYLLGDTGQLLTPAERAALY